MFKSTLSDDIIEPLGPMQLPTRLSPSSIVAWRQCPRLWKLRYVDKVPEPTTSALARGIASHDALDGIFDRPAAERSEALLHGLFRQSWSSLRQDDKYASLFAGDREAERAWGLESLGVLSSYLELEDPRIVEPFQREQRMSSPLKGPIREV